MVYPTSDLSLKKIWKNSNVALRYRSNSNVELSESNSLKPELINYTPIKIQLRSANLFYDNKYTNRFSKTIYPNEFVNEKNSDVNLYNECNYILIIEDTEKSNIEQSHFRLLSIGIPIIAVSILLGAIGG